MTHFFKRLLDESSGFFIPRRYRKDGPCLRIQPNITAAGIYGMMSFCTLLYFIITVFQSASEKT